MGMKEAAALVVRVLTETMEEKVTGTNVEIARVTPAGGYQLFTRAEVEALIAQGAVDAAAEGGRQ